MIEGNYNKWIVILQEFNLEFFSTKSKKSLFFAELMSDIPSLDEDEVHADSFMDENIFLILTAEPWYGDIIIYLQTLNVPPHLSSDECICLRHNAKNYLIIGDTLYHWGWIPFCVIFVGYMLYSLHVHMEGRCT